MQIPSKKTLEFLPQQLAIIFVILLGIFCLQMQRTYKEFDEFLQSDKQICTILNQNEKIKKNGRIYYSLRLNCSGVQIFTNSYEKLVSERVSVRFLALDTLDFWTFLRSNFYLPSASIFQLKSEQNPLVSYFLQQHKNQKMQEFYGALFFAKSISKELRNDVNFYGIAHLLAISGYHLGLIYSVLFFIFALIYRFFQRRFFPYRNIYLDLSLIIFIILSAYFYLIGFVASYFRSFVMAIIGFIFILRGIKILSFLHLFLAFLLCACIKPAIVFNVGFFFSCLGVFYIFLYAHHYKIDGFFKIIGLEISTFLCMVLPVLYFFPLLSLQQFFAILLTPLFAIFYPISLFLHIINQGDLLDFWLLKFLDFKLHAINFHLEFKYFLLYLILSFLAIFNKYLLIILLILNLLVFGKAV